MSWLRTKYFDELPALSIRGPELRRSLARVSMAWMFGSAWMVSVGGATMLNFSFLARFDEFHWGLMTALGFAATLTQLPASWIVERTGVRKLPFLYSLSIGRGLWLLVALMPLTLLWVDPAIVRWTALIMIFLAHSISNLGSPAWSTWMADLVPSRIRGRFFATRRQLALISQLIASMSVGTIFYLVVPSEARDALKDKQLSAAEMPALVAALTGIFLVAAVCGVMDAVISRPIREVAWQGPRRSIQLWRIIAEPMQNRNFVRFSVGVAILTFGSTLANPFFGLTCRTHLGFNDFWVNIALMVCGLIAGMLTSKSWGRLVDRWGRRPVLLLGTSLAIFDVWLWLLIPPLWPWKYLVFLVTFCSGVVGACNIIVQFNTLLTFTDQAGKSTYLAAHSLIVALAGMIGGVCGGTLAKMIAGWQWQLGPLVFLNYHVMFLLCGAVRATSLFWLIGLAEPTARPARQLIRQMSVGAWHHVATVAVFPLRLIGRWPHGPQRQD